MKRFIALLLCSLFILSTTLTGCGTKNNAKDSAANKKEVAEVTDDSSVKVLNVYTFTNEVDKMLAKYKSAHPDFPYEIKTTMIATTDGLYQPALDAALAAGGADAPDLYCAESAFVLKI
jgi:hypothetical protein